MRPVSITVMNTSKSASSLTRNQFQSRRFWITFNYDPYGMGSEFFGVDRQVDSRLSVSVSNHLKASRIPQQ